MASFTRRPASGLGILEKPSFDHFVFLVFQLKKCWSTIEYYSVLKHGATFFSLIYIYLSTTAVGTGKPPASSGDHRRQNLQPQSIYSTNTPKGSRGQDPGPHKKEKDRCGKTARAQRPGDTQATRHLQGSGKRLDLITDIDVIARHMAMKATFLQGKPSGVCKGWGSIDHAGFQAPAATGRLLKESAGHQPKPPSRSRDAIP